MKLEVSFDKSNEDIPVLTVSRQSWSIFDNGMHINNVITGNKAIELWEELTNKKQEDSEKV